MKTSPKLLLVFKVSSFCHFIQQSSIPEYGSYYLVVGVSITLALGSAGIWEKWSTS